MVGGIFASVAGLRQPGRYMPSATEAGPDPPVPCFTQKSKKSRLRSVLGFTELTCINMEAGRDGEHFQRSDNRRSDPTHNLAA
jgi:hypothetical protein